MARRFSSANISTSSRTPCSGFTQKIGINPRLAPESARYLLPVLGILAVVYPVIAHGRRT
jgi:hypothetical protein